MFTPFNTFRNVKAIPPAMIIPFTLSKRLFISWILSATLAPPKMAKNGRAGEEIALEKYSSSFFIKNPQAFCGRLHPTIELKKITYIFISLSFKKFSKKNVYTYVPCEQYQMRH